MATWYKVSTYGKPEITAVEVIKETAKFATYMHPNWDGKGFDERRVAKDGEFFPTFAEARAVLLERFQLRMYNATNEHQLAKKYWEEVFMMEASVEN